MSTVLVSGKIFRQPERKTSKNGKEFTIATVKETQGETAIWWKVLAFGDSADELASLGDGEAVSVSGLLKVEPYSKNGETKIGFSVLADRLISAHRPKRDKPRSDNAKPASNDRSGPSVPFHDDEIPF